MTYLQVIDSDCLWALVVSSVRLPCFPDLVYLILRPLVHQTRLHHSCQTAGHKKTISEMDKSTIRGSFYCKYSTLMTNTHPEKQSYTHADTYKHAHTRAHTHREKDRQEL